MRLLTVPNWSFGRDRDLLRLFEDLLTGWVTIHDLNSDVDHNRTVTAFSGEADVVFERLERLAEAAFERLDLNRHIGVHPRVGALDVCPFVRVSEEPYPLATKIELFAQRLASRFDLPVFLYERSEKGRHAADLPTLRAGGFGGLLLRGDLGADFGPARAHPRLGATIMGERPFLLALNVNFHGDEVALAKRIAKDIRDMRQSGDDRFTGVRSLGFFLTSRSQVQVSINITQPDEVRVDPLIEWVMEQGRRHGLTFAGTELIGVIRESDVPFATRLKIRDSQVVKGV